MVTWAHPSDPALALRTRPMTVDRRVIRRKERHHLDDFNELVAVKFFETQNGKICRRCGARDALS